MPNPRPAATDRLPASSVQAVQGTIFGMPSFTMQLGGCPLGKVELSRQSTIGAASTDDAPEAELGK